MIYLLHMTNDSLEPKKKILIVDDDADFMDMLKECLNMRGYDVLTLSDAKHIMHTLHSFSPDLILLDLIMPGIDGLEVCEMLNGDPTWANIPIIVMSGLNKDVDKLKAFKEGIEDYFVKPIKIEVLLSSIEKFLRAKSEKD